MNFGIYCVLNLYIILTFAYRNPNLESGESEVYFKVAAKIDESDDAEISGSEGMWCHEDSASYMNSGIAAAALNSNSDCSDGKICYCGDVAGNPCAAQILVDKDYGKEDAFDKRMCDGCIYKLSLLDLFEYRFKNNDDQAKVRHDADLYIKFYRAVHPRQGVHQAPPYTLTGSHEDYIFENIISWRWRDPLILLETRALLHLFKGDGGCITRQGIMTKMKDGRCRDGQDVPYPTGTVDFSKCNPNSDGTIGEECNIPLVKRISKQIFRAYISKTQYGCFTNFRLLPREYFVENWAVKSSWPCNVAPKNDEISDECGDIDDEDSKCIARFTDVSNLTRTIGQINLPDEKLPYLNCGNCYVVRLWIEAANPFIETVKYHKMEMKVIVYGQASNNSGGLYDLATSRRDYRIPDVNPNDCTKEGINRDVELLWEPVKKRYKNLCRRGNCRLCVDQRVSSGLDVAVSDALRKEINLSDYSFKKGGIGSDGLDTNPTITDQEGKLRRPFKHFIHMDGEEFGTLNYEGGGNGDKCGMGYVEWEYVCFERGANLRFSANQRCGSSAEIRITKGGDNNVTANIDAFAATMMLLIGTENLDGEIVGPCDACEV